MGSRTPRLVRTAVSWRISPQFRRPLANIYSSFKIDAVCILRTLTCGRERHRRSQRIVPKYIARSEGGRRSCWRYSGSVIQQLYREQLLTASGSQSCYLCCWILGTQSLLSAVICSDVCCGKVENLDLADVRVINSHVTGTIPNNLQ